MENSLKYCWGKSSERITDSYALDPFSTVILLENGRSIYGIDHRDRFTCPSADALLQAVERHYKKPRNLAKMRI